MPIQPPFAGKLYVETSPHIRRAFDRSTYPVHPKAFREQYAPQAASAVETYRPFIEQQLPDDVEIHFSVATPGQPEEIRVKLSDALHLPYDRPSVRRFSQIAAVRHYGDRPKQPEAEQQWLQTEVENFKAWLPEAMDKAFQTAVKLQQKRVEVLSTHIQRQSEYLARQVQELNALIRRLGSTKK